MPPYSTLCATLLAADTTWSGLGIRSTIHLLPRKLPRPP